MKGLMEALALLQLAPLCLSLSMSEFNVPEFAHFGKRVVLKCEHQLSYNDGRLESVKWYKIMNGGTRWVNFYTFTPGGLEKERKQTRHKMEGINILMSRSNEHQVVLKKVQISSSGSYKCEVTMKRDRLYSGGPPFDTITGQGRMQVIALPSSPPEISGGGSHYAYGDTLDLNCTSKPSYPPTKLTWYVNNEAARPSAVEETLVKTEQQLYFSEARLTLPVSPQQFHFGEMRLKCVASLIDEPIEASQLADRDGIILQVNKIPEAMKLHQNMENIFDVPVTGGSRKFCCSPQLLLQLIAVCSFVSMWA